MIEELDELLLASQKEGVKASTGISMERLADGEYDAYIEAVEFTESKSKKLMFKWEFIITGPSNVGSHEWKYDMLTSPENMLALTTNLNKFDVEFNTIKEAKTKLGSMLDTPVKLTIKTSSPTDPQKDGYRNISVIPTI